MCPCEILAGHSLIAGQVPQWERSTEAIDKGLLLSRDPILFYDEVPLYESELDDNGVSSLTVKVTQGCLQYACNVRSGQSRMRSHARYHWSLL